MFMRFFNFSKCLDHTRKHMYFNGKLLQVVEEGYEVVFHKDFSVEWGMYVYNHQQQLDQLVIDINNYNLIFIFVKYILY